MTLTGKQLINGSWIADAQQNGTEARNPVDNSVLPTRFIDASLEDVALATAAAAQAFPVYSALSDTRRAGFLDEIALELEKAADTIVARCMLETALPEQRLRGELGRTSGQLRQFSTLLTRADWRRPAFDQAMPERTPVPKPDVRLTQVALGPVVVFSASNFPLAFSTAGGDTASALRPDALSSSRPIPPTREPRNWWLNVLPGNCNLRHANRHVWSSSWFRPGDRRRSGAAPAD